MFRKLDHNVRGVSKTLLMIAAIGLFIFAFVPVVSAHSPGRMNGGGDIQCGDFGTVSHGFELHCIAPEGADPVLPNNLEINWGGGENFHLDTLLTAVCTNHPSFEESPPEAGFDMLVGSGTGSFNQVSGYTIFFTLIDNGEPGGGADLASYQIVGPSGTVLSCPLIVLDRGGNQQALTEND